VWVRFPPPAYYGEVKLLGWIAAAAFVGLLLTTLWGILRWSIISGLRTRGSAGRLRQPDAEGVARLCGIPVPANLVDFYRRDSRVTGDGLTLRAQDGREWEIGGFNPLAVQDVSEWRKVSRVPGIPIATDILKGVYYVSSDGTVMLASPEGTEIVAPDVKTFIAFEVVERSGGDV
jgi:hypothetical protein